MIISLGAEKAFNKIQYPFMRKSDETRNRRNVLQKNKDDI
jgi:hypothetical protein